MKEKKSMHHGALPSTFGNAKYLRYKSLTDQEKKLWEKIRNKQILNQKFRRQHPINIYILDFYCDQSKLSIELDGINHSSQGQKEYDTIRTNYLKSIGLTELRFTNEEIDEKMEEVIEKIKSVIQMKYNAP